MCNIPMSQIFTISLLDRAIMCRYKMPIIYLFMTNVLRLSTSNYGG